jgi:hypothetical protein
VTGLAIIYMEAYRRLLAFDHLVGKLEVTPALVLT